MEHRGFEPLPQKKQLHPKGRTKKNQIMYGNFKLYPHDNRVEVSDQGWVKRLSNGDITKGHLNYKGYLVFSFTKNKVKRVHDMVLETFVGPCPPGCQCGHKNTIKTDNRLENLQWVSPTDNNLNPITRKKRWAAKGGCIYVYLVGNRMVRITETVDELGEYLDLNRFQVLYRIRTKHVDANGGKILKVITIK